MRIFVTGAAGPLGRALTSALRRRGDAVVGQVRRRSGVDVLRNLGAEPVMSDLTRARLLADAMAGCDMTVHVAQYFDLWAPQASSFHSVNVYGAENVMNAALEARVRRVVFVSSSVTIGEQPGYWGTEHTVHRGYTITSYERSKVTAERAVMRYRSKGLEVVVVNPALVISPGDPGWMGRLFTDFISGRRRRAPDAPLGWVSVDDAANGIALAANNGQSGSRYILSGDTLSTRELMTRVTKLANRPNPGALPRPLAIGSAALSEAAAGLLGTRPRYSVDEARFATSGFRVDGGHASAALGLEYTPMARYLPPVVASYRSVALRMSA
jgi:nucleoside-diphosphate-sugar epimerase